MKILSTRTIQALTICTCALLVSACSNNNDDIYQFIKATKAKHVGNVKPLPQFEPYKNFTYSAEKLRDPFEPSADLQQKPKAAANSLRPDRNRPREPLESFPLDTLSMVGIMEQKKNLWGLIKDPQGIVHRVQVGNYMGQNEGRITQITDTSIHVNEIVPDGIGGYIERDASIAIGTK
jgi:type IV pilus assembly protein PilP